MWKTPRHLKMLGYYIDMVVDINIGVSSTNLPFNEEGINSVFIKTRSILNSLVK